MKTRPISPGARPINHKRKELQKIAYRFVTTFSDIFGFFSFPGIATLLLDELAGGAHFPLDRPGQVRPRAEPTRDAWLAAGTTTARGKS